LQFISAARTAISGPARRALRSVAALQLPVVLPEEGWGTKGFQFWTFLSLLLAASNCARILELGSGRSTITLAEYAKFRGARLISLETDRRWFNKARWELRCLGLSDAPIHLIKWQSGGLWYDVEQFRSIVKNEGSFDFAFIDGPNNETGVSVGIRDSEVALREIVSCTLDADIVVVDDVHRRHILDTIDRMLTDAGQYSKYFYDYSILPTHKNTICVCVRKSSRACAELTRIQEMLNMRFYDAFDRNVCSED
jgi:predicted O-methyltransferase YrrM